MASLHASCLFLIAAHLATISYSMTPPHCIYQSFPERESYELCLDLPLHNAYLHYTYDAKNETLSIAYVAKPEKPEGWVAWALNFQGSGMVGSEALIAFQDKGVYVVKTYNLVSTTFIEESELSFKVWDLAVLKHSFGQIILFAKLHIPANAELYQVWQVGDQVKNGMPMQHSLSPEHLSSSGVVLAIQEVATEPIDGPSAAQGSNGGQGMNNNIFLLFLLPFFVACMVV